MRQDVDQYIWNCHNCQLSQTPDIQPLGFFPILPVPDKPWDAISMDFVVGSLVCEGFDAIWVVVDCLPQMQHFIPSHKTIDALGLAELFLRDVRPYIRIWPRMRVYEKIRLHTWMW